MSLWVNPHLKYVILPALTHGRLNLRLGGSVMGLCVIGITRQRDVYTGQWYTLYTDMYCSPQWLNTQCLCPQTIIHIFKTKAEHSGKREEPEIHCGSPTEASSSTSVKVRIGYLGLGLIFFTFYVVLIYSRLQFPMAVAWWKEWNKMLAGVGMKLKQSASFQNTSKIKHTVKWRVFWQLSVWQLKSCLCKWLIS